MDRETWAERNARSMNPLDLPKRAVEEGAWYESKEEIADKLAWGRRKAVLLRWVRLQMGRRLTARERHCIELVYFRGLSFRQAGAATGTRESSVHRATRRAIRKLRAAANEEGVTLWSGPKRLRLVRSALPLKRKRGTGK